MDAGKNDGDDNLSGILATLLMRQVRIGLLTPHCGKGYL